MGAGKVARRTSKWAVYLVISFVTGGAWILYFADAPTLFVDFFAGEAALVAYAPDQMLTDSSMMFIMPNPATAKARINPLRSLSSLTE